MSDPNPAEVRKQLQQLEQENGDLKTQLNIIRISEPIFSPTSEKPTTTPSKRNSDVSSLDNPTPASLEADLSHYKVRTLRFFSLSESLQVSAGEWHTDESILKELFSKLRFSYVEQVTKEKFLRAIVGDPPLVVGHNENVVLETQLAEVKAELRARKEEVRAMTEEMEKMGRDLANRECS